MFAPLLKYLLHSASEFLFIYFFLSSLFFVPLNKALEIERKNRLQLIVLLKLLTALS